MRQKKNPLFHSFAVAAKEIGKFAGGAGRLANEWRDTLSYAALGGIAVADALHNRNFIASTYIIPVICREISRSLSWRYSNEWRHHGGGISVTDNQKFCAAALTVASGINAAWSISPPTSLIGTAVSSYVFLDQGIKADGAREILKSYRNTMWDYPRKKNGGKSPPNQTTKLLRWIRETANSLEPDRKIS